MTLYQNYWWTGLAKGQNEYGRIGKFPIKGKRPDLLIDTVTGGILTSAQILVDKAQGPSQQQRLGRPRGFCQIEKESYRV
jgi:hypothetical protein